MGLTSESQTASQASHTSQASNVNEHQDAQVPTASHKAVTFLQGLGPEDLEQCLFTDNLVTVSDSGKELGEFTVSVEKAQYYGTPAYLIHANSHGAIDAVPCGTSITAYVTCSLETLEQQHHEYVKLDSHPLDRKTFITNFSDRIVINRVITQGEEVQRTENVYKKEEIDGFISEASNLLLQRLLVVKGGASHMATDMRFLSLDSDVNLCHATYMSMSSQAQTLPSGVEVQVSGLERTIHSCDSMPTTWHAFFLSSGHMTSRVQVGSPVSMKLMSLPRHLKGEDEPPGEASKDAAAEIVKSPKKWKDDIELFSKFLDRKEELKCQYATYMRQHPELKALLADFLQMVLLRKPADVVAFAHDYFQSFTSKSFRPPSSHDEKPQKEDEML